MGRIARRFRSPVFTAVVVALVVGGTAAAAPTAVTSVVKYAKRAGSARTAGRANRAKYATKAGTAKKAGLALLAGNANALQGHPATDFASGPSNRKIDFRAHAGTGETTLLDTGKFGLTASCDGTGHVRVLASTRVDHAALESLGNGGDTRVDDFTIGGSPRNLGPTQGEYRSVMYTEPGGQTVELQYIATDKNIANSGPPLGGAVDCLVSGFAIVG